LDNSISADDIFDHLNDLIKNLDSIYHSVSDENDLEVILNSLISLVIISTNEKLSKLVTALCESIVKAPLAEKFGIVKLRTSVFFRSSFSFVKSYEFFLSHLRLSNLFHGLMLNSKERYTVFINLARCSIQVGNLQYLSTDLDTVKKLLVTWKSSTEETQALYRLLFEALAKMNDSQGALKVITELLSTYEKSNASKSRDDVHKCIIYCINDPNIFIFDSLLLLEPIRYLEGELIHDVRKFYRMLS
jgi:translation initiation factor 3 subunit M